MFHVEVRARIGRGRNPKCPICKRGIDSDEKRLETWLFGAQSRQFHFHCAKHLARRIIFTVEQEEEGKIANRRRGRQQ